MIRALQSDARFCFTPRCLDFAGEVTCQEPCAHAQGHAVFFYNAFTHNTSRVLLAFVAASIACATDLFLCFGGVAETKSSSSGTFDKACKAVICALPLFFLGGHWIHVGIDSSVDHLHRSAAGGRESWSRFPLPSV